MADNYLPKFFTPSRTKHKRKITPKQEKQAEARRKIELLRYEQELRRLEE